MTTEISTDKNEEILRLGRTGMTFDRIAAVVGIGYRSVTRHWHRHASVDDRRERTINSYSGTSDRTRRGPRVHVEFLKPGQSFTDDPAAIAIDYGRVPLRAQTWVPYIAPTAWGSQ